MNVRKNIPDLINDSMFISLEQYNSKEIKDKVSDLEQHQKTVRLMLTQTLKDKIKEKRNNK